MRTGVRFFGLSACLLASACYATGSMLDSETDTDTDTDTGGTAATLSTSGASQTSATNGASMTGNTTATTTPPTTDDMSTTTMAVDPSATTVLTEDTGCEPGTEGCPCDVGSTCDGDLVCIDGTCMTEAPCDQPDAEPNDSFEEAIDLGAVACAMEYQTAEGALDGLDADFYTLVEGDGGICLSSDPQATVDADQDVRVCVYLGCDDGTGDVNCGNDLEEDTFDELNGCCGTNEARLFNAGCPGFPFPVEGVYFIRVSSADEDTCLPYELGYRVD